MDRGQALTSWRAEVAVCQQAQNQGTKGSYSPAGEQSLQCVSRCKTEGQNAGTHRLGSRGCTVSAGKNTGRHSLPAEQRSRCFSKCKIKGHMAGTHQLEIRGCSVSAGGKWRDRGQALTNWRTEDTVNEQVQNGGTEGRHSPVGEQRTRCVSRCKMERPRVGTHFLKSRRCIMSAGTKRRVRWQAPTNWRTEDAVCQ
jgi:hypothetical protein